jgi:hypothetical protein
VDEEQLQYSSRCCSHSGSVMVQQLCLLHDVVCESSSNITHHLMVLLGCVGGMCYATTSPVVLCLQHVPHRAPARPHAVAAAAAAGGVTLSLTMSPCYNMYYNLQGSRVQHGSSRGHARAVG